MKLIKIFMVSLLALTSVGCGELNELIEGKKDEQASGTANPFGVQLFASDWTAMASSSLLETASVYNLRITNANIQNAIVSWTVLYKGANCDLQTFEDAEGVENQAQLLCTTWGQVGVEVVALFPSGSEYRTVLNLGVIDSDPGNGGDSKSYRIYRVLNGTGGGTWGSNGWLQQSGDPARGIVYVGQVLRIINQDDDDHQPAGQLGLNCAQAPFPLVNGQSYDCEITQELLTPDEYIIDTMNSTDGKLTFKTIDAERIYDDQFTCTACHADKVGSSKGQIDAAIRMNIPAMKYLEAELDRADGLTADEKLDAMVWWMNNGN